MKPTTASEEIDVEDLFTNTVIDRLDGWSSSYYEIPEWAKEIDDLIAHKNMSFRLGNIFKAAYRMGKKPGVLAEYDLEKIIWFAQRELEWLRRTQK